MTADLSNRRLVRAAALLGVALLLAAAARWLYGRGEYGLGLGAVGLALLLCFGVVYLCAPLFFRWTRLHGVRLPWSYGFTREGLFFLLTVLAVGMAAVTSGNNLIYLIFSSMLAAMVLSGLVSRLGLSGLQLNVSFPPHLFARQRVLAQVTLRNLKRWMPSFSIRIGLAPSAPRQSDIEMDEIYCPMITGRGRAGVSAPLVFARRGLYRRADFWLRSKFPFSFVERKARLALAQEVLVYPSVEPSPVVDDVVRRLDELWRTSARGDSHDLYRLRPALPDDGARFVDWKGSARSRELMVREFTREDLRRLEIVLDRRVQPGESWELRFESTVELCAAVVWRLHSLQSEIRFASDDVSILCSPNSPAVYDILRYLALAQPVVRIGELHETEPQRMRTDVRCRLVFAAGQEAELLALQSSTGRDVLVGRS
jgi:uncharacterized protein (DUF58 family)